MEYRTLGRSGITVSRLCLGTMMFGGPTDAATSERLIARAAAAGINFLDTADGYNAGRSEEVVGAAIRPNRHAWVLATKIANKVGKGPNEGGLSRRWVMQGTEACLKRLGTDVIDILYLHKEDHATPLETTVRALGDLVRAGKIRHFGVSNYRSWRIAEICRLCDELGIDRPIVSQPYYNAMNRQPEVEQLPAAAHYGLGIFPYSPLARGVLTAKYRQGAVRRHFAQRFFVIKIVSELGNIRVVFIFAFGQAAFQTCFLPQPFAHQVDQARVFGPTLRQQIAHTVQHCIHG